MAAIIAMAAIGGWAVGKHRLSYVVTYGISMQPSYHAGDLVIVAKNYGGAGGPTGIWKAIRPAIVALDPTYKGDEAAFCKAYAAGDYAPDLVAQPRQPDD